MTFPAATTRWAAAAVSGLLLAAARPPFDLGPLALVALVPLFVAWRDAGLRSRAALAFVAGFVYYAVLVVWLWNVASVGFLALAALLAAWWAAVGAIVGWLDRRGFRTPWLTAAVWVLGEALMARVPFGGFSWGEVGYALHDSALARDVASVGGVALVSYLVVAGNAFLADIVARPPARATIRALAGLLAVVLVASLAPVVQADLEPKGTLRVAILQGNDLNRDLTEDEVDSRLLANNHFDLVSDVDQPVDLIVFPESSMDEDPRTDRELGDRLAAVAQEEDAWVLANATADDPEDPRNHAYNLNVLYGPDGEVEGTYAKRHLVPFGERPPASSITRRIIPMLDEEVPRDFWRGQEPGIFDVAGLQIATVICFESAFGYEIRPLIRDGAEVIVLSTNNRSYGRSANSAQHLAIGQMRAAETGRPLVQAAISGISAFVDAEGRVLAETDLFERTVLQGSVVAYDGQTLYVRYGEWVVLGSLLTVVICGIVAGVRGRRRRSVDSSPGEPAPVAGEKSETVDRLLQLAMGEQR